MYESKYIRKHITLIDCSSPSEKLYNDFTNETHCKMDIGEEQVKTKENKRTYLEKSHTKGS